MRDFRKIKAWQRAHALSIAIHTLSRGFSRKGYSHLRSQLNRAAESIPTNIVEGCGARTNKDFARFLGISIDSANETEYHLLAAHDLSLIREDDWQKTTSEIIEVRKMIFGYRRKVLSEEESERSLLSAEG